MVKILRRYGVAQGGRDSSGGVKEVELMQSARDACWEGKEVEGQQCEIVQHVPRFWRK